MFFREIKGMVLITVLLLTVLLILMTVSMVFISTNHLAIMGNIESKERALKAAEAGVQYAIYILDENPTWGLSGLDPATLNITHRSQTDNFPRADGLEEEIEYDDGTTFTITFDPASKYRSVNNLFYKPDGVALDNPVYCNTPPYSAKIISVGKCGNSIKVLEAYLVRSDYYPYAINQQGRMDFGASSNTTIHGPAPEEPGYIFSNWKHEGPNTPFTYSISLGNSAELHCNGGTFSARGKINIPDPNSFDGNIQEDLEQKIGMSEIDVDDMVTRGKNALSPGSYYSPGTAIITEERVGDRTVLVFHGPDCFTLDPNGVLKLNKDIYVNGNKTGVASDNCDPNGNYDEMLNADKSIKSSYSDRVFNMHLDPDALTEEYYIPTYSYGIRTGEKKKQRIRDAEFTFDINDHTIFSDSHLIFSIDVIGNGKFISNGEIAYTKGVENKDIINISGNDLVIQISDRVTSSYGRGLFYGEDDFKIQPHQSGSVLGGGVITADLFDPDPLDPNDLIPDPNDPNFLLDPNGNQIDPNDLDFFYPPPSIPVSMQVKVTQTYYPGTKLSQTDAVTYEDPTYIGFYNDPGPRPDWVPSYDPWPPPGHPYYIGSSVLVRRVDMSGGDHKLMVNGLGGDFKICLYPASTANNKNLEDYKIGLFSEVGGGYETKLLKSNGLPAPASALSALGITQAQLDRFGREIAYSFNSTMPSAHIELDGTIVALNKLSSTIPSDLENASYIDAGDENTGVIKIGWTIDYITSMVTIHDARFKVKLTSCHEIR